MSGETLEKRDPKKPFTMSELKAIQLSISHLHEFTDGYVHIERLRREGLAEEEPALDRFFETALTAILNGLYPKDRNRGLLPVLRLANCKKLADEIEAALDRKIGSSTFAEIEKTFRDKAIAHPHFSTKAMWPIVENLRQHLQRQEDIDAFNEAGHIVRSNTAALYHWFKKAYPEIVADADSVEY